MKMAIPLVLVLALSLGIEVANADYRFGTPNNLGLPVNTSSDDGGSISTGGLTLFLYSDRPGGYGAWDIWSKTRADLSDPWR